MSKSRRFNKVFVIGLDGLEPKIVEAMIAAGQLPNLGKLAAQGGLARVATTSPAQTPVAWSTFATGRNPGGHGIFDFIRRDPKTYLPDLALNKYEQKSAWLPPKAVNLRRGKAVWDLLASAGIGSTVLRCPCNYPPVLDRGRMLAGMGVPDLRGGLGTPTFFSSEPNLVPRESEQAVPLPARAGTAIPARLLGPRSPKDRQPIRFEFTIDADPTSKQVTIRSQGSPKEIVVKQGEWSDWLRVGFKAGILQTVAGLARFFLVRFEPELELYASPINFDPENPLFPISAPAGYASELAGAIGTYYTTGMVEDHTGLNNGRIDEWAFLDQCAQVWDERDAMVEHELKRFNEGLFYVLHDTPDRVQHMFWRFTEPDHPANQGVVPSAELARVIEDQYRRADESVGKVLNSAGDGSLVIALSDHGFGTFRRGFNINTWLHDQGWLTLKDGRRPGDAIEGYPNGVDWGKTRAYALGLGGIYLNLAGREGQGIVTGDEAERIKREIADGLAGLVDPEHGVVAVNEAKTREEIYHGPYLGEAPDLLLHLAAGYRISWDSSLGGIPEGWFEDNTKRWGGDHIIDPSLVPGVLLMNQPFRHEGARLLDLAPTILDALGQPSGSDMEGSSLLR